MRISDTNIYGECNYDELTLWVQETMECVDGVHFALPKAAPQAMMVYS